jgi:ketosteroid isomerase-like protein
MPTDPLAIMRPTMAHLLPTPKRKGTPGRSSEHHVVVGLGFLSALKNGDIDACAEMLHPDVEWHPSPKQLETEVFRGRHQVRHQIQTLHDRFDRDLDIKPEEGRQIGDHVLIVAVFSGTNHITGQEVKARECWVVSVRDDMWARVVVYPNAPAARLGFEELLRTAGDDEPHVAEARVPGAEDDEPRAVIEVPTDIPILPVESDDITLTFTLEEAAALNDWLARLGADDPGVTKIRDAVEYIEAIIETRRSLAEAGLTTAQLTDAQVAQLGQAIAGAARPLAA